MKLKLLGIAGVLSAGLLLTAGMNSAYGQQASDALRFSQYNYGFGTARSAALGGAFTSLGADLSSMNINPAGMGMYRSSELSFTPRVLITSIRNNFGAFSDTKTRTRFGLNNIGLAYTIEPYSVQNALKKVTVGFSYNRMADFNGISFSRGAQDYRSIADLFASRLNSNGTISAGSIGSPSEDIYRAFRNHDFYYWGPILAYQSFLLNADPNDDTFYSVGPFFNQDGTLLVDGALYDGDLVAPSQRITTRGGIDEYSFSAGFNISNVFYTGVTLGIQDFSYREFSDYMEDGVSGNQGNLQSLRYGQWLKLTGSGVNIKFGIAAQPVEGLRLGVAIHTPTYSNIRDEYNADMTVNLAGETEGFSDTPFLVNRYNLDTPTRFLAGISYTFGKMGLVSFDYERTWYNKMRGHGSGLAFFNNDIRDTYRAANTFKAGAEVMVHPQVALRAGYAYYGTPYTIGLDKKFGSAQNISGGIGYRMGFLFADLTYAYMNYKGVPYRYFNESFEDGDIVSNSVITPEQKRHSIILTLGAKF